MPYDNKDYLMVLYTRFCETTEKASDEEEAVAELRETLSKPQCKLLLRVEDALNARHDTAAFTAFVSGFRLAAGIATELHGGWFSFTDDEERRAQAAFEQDHNTI